MALLCHCVFFPMAVIVVLCCKSDGAQYNFMMGQMSAAFFLFYISGRESVPDGGLVRHVRRNLYDRVRRLGQL